MSLEKRAIRLHSFFLCSDMEERCRVGDPNKYISQKRSFDPKHQAVFLPHVIRECFSNDRRWKSFEIYFFQTSNSFGHPPVFLPGISEGTFHGITAGRSSPEIYSLKRSVFAEHPHVFLPGISEGDFFAGSRPRRARRKI